MVLGTVADVLEAAFLHDSALLHDDDLVSIGGKFDGVSRHDDSLPCKEFAHCFFDHKLANVDIHCAQDIIKEQYALAGVERSSKGYSGLLSS
jgi:hypothetical protein